jgi:hypothetical protein
MLTKNDICQLMEVFATRKELYLVRDELKSDIVGFKDEILHEIKAMREELTVVVGYRQHIEDHAEMIIRHEESITQLNTILKST